MLYLHLVFPTTGGLGQEIAVAYKRLAELLAVKRKSEYSITHALMRGSLSFALLRSAESAISGCRSMAFHRDRDVSIDLGYKESHLGVV